MTTTTEYARLAKAEWAKAKAADGAWTALHHANASAAHARAATQHAHDDDALELADEAAQEAADALTYAANLIKAGKWNATPAPTMPDTITANGKTYYKTGHTGTALEPARRHGIEPGETTHEYWMNMKDAERLHAADATRWFLD